MIVAGVLPSDKLYANLQLLLAGHRTEDVMKASIGSLAAVIGFAATSIEQADRMCDEVAGDLKRTILDNWNYLCEVRAQTTEAGTS